MILATLFRRWGIGRLFYIFLIPNSGNQITIKNIRYYFFSLEVCCYFPGLMSVLSFPQVIQTYQNTKIRFQGMQLLSMLTFTAKRMMPLNQVLAMVCR